MTRRTPHKATLVAAAATGLALSLTAAAPAASARPAPLPRPAGTALPPAGAIDHVLVIDLENESYGETFGSGSPATYLNGTLVPKGELLPGYYAVGHVSLDNYLAQVSGQAPNQVTSSDCTTAAGGAFDDVLPGTPDPDQARYPGQTDGQGCVYPADVQTIGGQLQDARRLPGIPTAVDWREYAGDMGNDPARDGGTPDPSGGTDCAHPTQTNGVGADDTENAEGPNATGSQVKSSTTDQYVDRHNPFAFFHSVTDDASSCAQHVVPLGTVTAKTGGGYHYQGHLAQDLASPFTTPRFAMVSPNVCDDGHDATCAGVNAAGTTTGGLVGADAFLKAWMPLILDSPAYKDGSMLVMITFDEGSVADVAAGDHEQPGPGSANPGYSPLLNTPIPSLGGKTYYQLLGFNGLTPGQEPPAGTMPGGGQVGALLLNPFWIKAGSTDTTGSYNHYSALRTFEDLLGLRTGGADGQGHLGFAATASDFGPDVFNGLSLPAARR
ncbi:phosphoesterase [Streptacidiphilus fuscans]|uniref:Phosphoesterase n=1 Tax=Streptacidiphilus fuscans TaxID=2789292 RepID=A0A931FCV7_9ACTN|nr:phosphoesterase [Streptacidiphilus fuscans]MBF9068883.1 phosphoesterase [Streptacidiphilus fuscans]MBF9073337.1 phosphoesterase [Streptacidiphilus fuscans]